MSTFSWEVEPDETSRITVSVGVHHVRDQVYVALAESEVPDLGDVETHTVVKPPQARQMAQALLDAADLAERKWSA